MMTETQQKRRFTVRCPNPQCDAPLAIDLEGQLKHFFRRCNRFVTIVRNNGIDIVKKFE